MWCATRTRTRMPGATRSGARRTAALRSGSLSYAADAALGELVLALESDAVELLPKVFDLGVLRRKARTAVASLARGLFGRQFAEVTDRQAPAENVVAL